MIIASSIEVDDRHNLQEMNTFQDNKNDEQKKWKNFMMEKEQVFNQEFNSKVTTNNFASNGYLNAPSNV